MLVWKVVAHTRDGVHTEDEVPAADKVVAEVRLPIILQLATMLAIMIWMRGLENFPPSL